MIFPAKIGWQARGVRHSAALMSVPSSKPSARLGVLDALRGLAALWVGLYHFTQNGKYHGGFPGDSPLKSAGTYGWVGVYAFFVISGFILPWTMERGGYRLGDFPRFLAKRALRLHPLYLLSVLAMLLPALLGPEAVAGMSAKGWRDWWPHFFYLNGIMGRPWLMDIYWTLAIEAQYYLVIGLVFPLLVHRRAGVRWAVMAAFLVVPLIWPEAGSSPPRDMPPFSALFGTGIVVFWKMTGRMGKLPCLLALAACAYVTWRVQGPPQALTAALSAAAILGVRVRMGALEWLGEISYPFYLFHLAVGGLVLPLLSALPRDPWRDGAAVLGMMAVSIFLARILHRVVESPAQRWSSAIRYRRPPAAG